MRDCSSVIRAAEALTVRATFFRRPVARSMSKRSPSLTSLLPTKAPSTDAIGQLDLKYLSGNPWRETNGLGLRGSRQSQPQEGCPCVLTTQTDLEGGRSRAPTKE